MVHNIYETFSKLLKTIFVVCKNNQTMLVSHKIRNHCIWGVFFWCYIHLCKSIYIYIHLYMPIYIYVCLYWLMSLLLLRKKWSSSYAGNSIYWNLFFRFAEICFSHQFFFCVFVYVCVRSLTKSFRPSSRSLCPAVVMSLVCWLYMCACVYVSLYMRVKMCR